MNLSQMVKSGYIPYMMETEGYDNFITTKEARINAVIKEIKATEDANYLLKEILEKHNLSINKLTNEELYRITRYL